MAITVTDSPNSPAPVGQKLIVMASSTNVAQSGFKFKVTVNDGVNTCTMYVSPNPANRLIVDVKRFFKLANKTLIGSAIVHAMTDQDGEPLTESGIVFATITITEAWLVAGVLTDDPGSAGVTSLTRYFWNATYQASDGYKPNPADRYALNGNTDRWLSDREWNTSRGISGLDQATTRVFIPVRESDYGVLSIIQGISVDTATKAQISIYDSSGTPHSTTVVFDGDVMLHLPFYPANLNANTDGWEKPVTYPGWRYIKIQAQDSGNAQVSVDYILYNTAVYGGLDCKHENVRLAWKGFSGGWEYFNFIKRNEESVNVQRKRYQKVIGDYAGTSFTFTKADAGTLEREPIVEQLMEINSDWLTEGEFLFLKSLIVSKQVFILHDNGTVTPVLIETNDYKMPRERSPKKKQLSLKLKLANDLWV